MKTQGPQGDQPTYEDLHEERAMLRASLQNPSNHFTPQERTVKRERFKELTSLLNSMHQVKYAKLY